MNTFCTIIDQAHIPFAKALHASVQEYDLSYEFFVLLIDSENEYTDQDATGIHWITLPSVLESTNAKAIVQKYLHKSRENELRWALKPVLIAWLLNHGKSVIYVDSDIFFVSDPGFLFDHLYTHSIILTPHWQSIDPQKSDHLSALLTKGYFNAGFIGASIRGLPAINWWAEACLFNMEKLPEQGFYDDQKYLDLVPFEFDSVNIITNRGCNLACWNMDTNKREIIKGRLMIAEKYEPVFIHFTPETIHHIVVTGNDKLLFPYLQEYIATLRRFLSSDDNLLPGTGIYNGVPFFVSLKQKLLIRTRIKRILYKIAETL